MFGDVEVDDAPAVVGEYDEDPQASGGNGEEIDRNKVLDVVGEERAPGLRGRGRALRDQARDRTLRHFNAELEEFACVQSNADVFSGSQSRRGKSQQPRSLDGRTKGDRRSEAHRQSPQKEGERVAGPQRE
jgi:hypothetical protein